MRPFGEPDPRHLPDRHYSVQPWGQPLANLSGHTERMTELQRRYEAFVDADESCEVPDPQC